MEMKTFAIRRRNAWKTVQELEAAAAISRKVGDTEMSDKVRWIRSYVVSEADGTIGTVCIYQAVGPEAIREHARRVGMPADEITPVAATVIVRADPKEMAKAA
jgi:thiamine biosynthesis protein ThiC